MLTRLRFKNWRSLRDVEINDLTPITVFIGANSSGKTNILDALYFLRYSLQEGIVQAVYNWEGQEKIRTADVDKHEAVELELTYARPEHPAITNCIGLQFKDEDVPFWFSQKLWHGNELIQDEPFTKLPNPDGLDSPGILSQNSVQNLVRSDQIAGEINNYVRNRWQMLDENFMPPLRMSTRDSGDLYMMDRCADNLLTILDFMRKTRSDVYEALQEDFTWLLTHVGNITTERDESETRVILRERGASLKEAPSISSGTARVMAMLAAYYVLDMRQAELPGLVVIEEPDTALNPGILRNFVEQLRSYTEGEHPRQFILTTHNPRFLDYFKPEEVRVVSRGEDGYTTVEGIPDHISEIWLDDHTLGEVWMTRSLGGLPE